MSHLFQTLKQLISPGGIEGYFATKYAEFAKNTKQAREEYKRRDWSTNLHYSLLGGMCFPVLANTAYCIRSITSSPKPQQLINSGNVSFLS